jgi:PhnB protein
VLELAEQFDMSLPAISKHLVQIKEKSMAKATSPIPSGKHTITAHLALKDAAKAIEFYKKAFGAEACHCLTTPDGRVMHADIKIGDSHLMLSDEFPERGGSCLSPTTLNGSTSTIHLYVADVDKAFERAIAAGAKAEMPPQDMFWGDRYGRLIDPFGQPWSLATHIEDITPEEMQKRSTDFCKQVTFAK